MKNLGPLLFCITFSIIGFAQDTIAIDKSSYYGIDENHKMIVFQQLFLDSLVLNANKIERFELEGETYSMLENQQALLTTESYDVVKATDTFKLFVTSLPIIKLNSTDSIVDEPKRHATFSYVDIASSFKSNVGIEWRGNSALKYPKKSYDLELREDRFSEKSINFKFGSLRDDDDWVMNSVYNEPLKLRSYFSTKLWLDVQKPHYIAEEPKAKSYTDMVFAEVFLNETYQGVYLFSEQLDRKLLQLKKIKGDTVLGELFKAGSYNDGTAFKAAPEFNNAFPHWAGFEMEYPYENYEAHWDNLHDFIAFVSNSTDSEFKNKISSYLDIDNAVDYFLFINLLRGTDNMSKNYFLAKYDQDTPYFFVPWDLDGVMGTIQDGKRIATTDDILTNNLFQRLKATNASDYRAKVKARWKELRTNVYSGMKLFEHLDSTYNLMNDQKIYERDELAWGRTNKIADDYEYLKKWLSERLVYLDSVFEEFE